jgi:hypothetical protein
MHGGKENRERVSVVKCEARQSIAKPKNRCEDDIKIYLK